MVIGVEFFSTPKTKKDKKIQFGHSIRYTQQCNMDINCYQAKLLCWFCQRINRNSDKEYQHSYPIISTFYLKFLDYFNTDRYCITYTDSLDGVSIPNFYLFIIINEQFFTCMQNTKYK